MPHWMKHLALASALALSGLTHAQAQAAQADEATQAESTGVIVNLNTATAAELEQLPGIGPSRAQAILEFRVKNGRFSQISQLMRIKGIGRSMLRKLRPHVTLGDADGPSAASPKPPNPVP